MAHNVFKRPMFKRGGTPAQGTGIMSHVEPRVNARFGYPDFSNVTQAPASMRGDLTNFRGSNLTKAPSNLLQYQKLMGGLTPEVEQSFSAEGDRRGYNSSPSPSVSEEDIYKQNAERRLAFGKWMSEARARNAAEAEKRASGYEKRYSTPSQAETPLTKGDILTEDPIDVYPKDKTGTDNTPPPAAPKKEVPDKTPGMTKEEEIKSEAGFLKNLLEDKDMNKGEIALVLAEALATPGGFNKKLEKARALAIPLIRQRGKEDKSYKLEAYKRYKDKEEAFIKYGQPTPYSKNIKTQAENQYKDHLIKTGGKPTKTKEDFEREYYVSNAKDADKQENEAALNNSSRTIIEPAINEVREYSQKLKVATAAKDKKGIESAEKNLKDILGKLSLYESNPAWKGSRLDLMLQKALKAGLKEGGRIGYALGSPMSNDQQDTMVKEEEETSTPKGVSPLEVQQTDSATGVVGEKPVEKLDYNTLRSRLPREINDQVVALLASSEAALQEFAYITTQEDVNAFNIKYGVNLIIPPTTQQS
jgi:hypothetical protein